MTEEVSRSSLCLKDGWLEVSVEQINDATVRVEIAPANAGDRGYSISPELNEGDLRGEADSWDLSSRNEGFSLSPGEGEDIEFSEVNDDPPPWSDVGRNEGGWITLFQRVPVKSQVFGLGEKTGYLEKSGGSYEMWNRDPNGFYTHNEDPLYMSIPFYIVRIPRQERDDRYIGVYVHQPEKTKFDVKHRSGRGLIGLSAGSPRMTLYVFSSTSIKDLVSEYVGLTGKPFMPPKWAIGYHHSKYGAPADGEEAKELAAEFRERGIPCDALYLDIQYMDDYKVFTWDDERFSKPEEIIDELHDLDFKVVTIVDPGIKEEENYEVYEDAVEGDLLVKDHDGDNFSGAVWPGFCVFPDFLQEEVRDWWTEKNVKFLEQGVDGIWNDMNEPAIFFGRKQLGNISQTIQEGIMEGAHLDYSVKEELANLGAEASNWLLHRDDRGKDVSHGQVHNLYAIYEALSTFDAFSTARPGERPFILTRSGFSGIQKYAASWTGDNTASWEHMRMSISMVLNMGMSGVPFAGPDVGGFAGDVEPELLTRWTQLGSLLPYFRNHSGLDTIPQEPWSFGDPFERINRKFISLRYRLLPYLYTTFYRSHLTGVPLARPLFWEFPHDSESFRISDQFMVGSDLLAAPVLERQANKRLVYLPPEDPGDETY
ncbi:hypothetical protein KGY64_03985, partial [Candidatus Bipolaricaulota bacterium]|nr:hypothetical protein [Candidatus Bipolaricaulota bacterium]